jgi:hypothetical protein
MDIRCYFNPFGRFLCVFSILPDIARPAASCYAERKETGGGFTVRSGSGCVLSSWRIRTWLVNSLVNLLNGEPDFEVVKALTDAGRVDEACGELKPDAILMDVCTENGSSGLKAAARPAQDFPGRQGDHYDRASRPVFY